MFTLHQQLHVVILHISTKTLYNHNYCVFYCIKSVLLTVMEFFGALTEAKGAIKHVDMLRRYKYNQ